MSDGTNTSTAATVSLSVIDNVTPTANGQSVTTNENTAVSGTLTGSDADSNPLTTYTVVSGPANGSLDELQRLDGGLHLHADDRLLRCRQLHLHRDRRHQHQHGGDRVDYRSGATAPTTTGVNPPTGLAGGGTTVIISGTGFTGATAVNFGSTAATTFTVNANGTQITATDPAGTGVVERHGVDQQRHLGHIKRR